VSQKERPAEPAPQEQPPLRFTGPARSYLLRNETPTRLTIRLDGSPNAPSAIVLPPLAETELYIQGEARAGEALAPLIDHNAVAFRELAKGEKVDWSGLPGLLFGGFMIYAIAGNVALEKNPGAESIVWFWIPLALVIAATGGLAVFGFGWSNVRLVATQVMTLLLVLLTVLGLTAGTIVYFGDGLRMLDGVALRDASQAPSVELLGRALQFALISIASLFPALLYFLFDRYRLGTLRESFEQSIFRLDPNVKTLADVRAKYGRQLDEVYGHDPLSARGRHLRGTRWPIWVCTLVVTLGWIVTVQPIGTEAGATSLLAFLAPEASPVAFAFLGAYYFAATSLLRRYTRGDLRPKAYSHVVVRIFIALIFAWVLEALFGPSPYVLALSFLVGVVPDTFWTAFNETARNQVLGKISRSLEQKNPLTSLEGIDLYDRARLTEEGVTNVESLAHHDLIDLILATRIPIARLVDWLDQAVLYLHVSEDHLESADGADSAGQPGKSLYECLRLCGIRTATDFMDTYKSACGADGNAALFSGLQAMGSFPPGVFNAVYEAMQDDEWIEALRHWRKHVKIQEGSLNLRVHDRIALTARSVGPSAAASPN